MDNKILLIIAGIIVLIFIMPKFNQNIALSDNLIQNPSIEYMNNMSNNIPDNWEKIGEDSSHVLSWVYDSIKQSKILKSEFISGIPDSFGWIQNIYNVTPDTWYEMSFDYATEGIEPNLNPDGTIAESTKYNGVSYLFYDSGNNFIGDATIWDYGPLLSDFDDNVWMYRTFQKKGLEAWRTVKKYFRTPSNTNYIQVKTYNYCKGNMYFDNFNLRKVSGNYDPELPAFKKSGTLNFIKYKGQNYFPIILLGFPKKDNGYVSMEEVKNAGFNSVMAQSYNINGTNTNVESIKTMLVNNDLSAVIYLPSIAETWQNDPSHTLTYSGKSNIISQINEWSGFENILAFNGPDESANGVYRGWSIQNMKPLEKLKAYITSKNSKAHYILNFGGVYQYTGLYSDLVKYYFPSAGDLVSSTINTPSAYPYNNIDTKLSNLVRYDSRKLINSNMHYLAYGLGVVDWSNWNGAYKDGEYIKKYVPFNIQRYQVWEQIINGAGGVWFWGAYHIDLSDSIYQHHWEQIKAISGELAGLYPVLLEPTYYSGWEVSDSRIDVMMKKHNGKIYLFTASNDYQDINDVTITLPGYSLTKVTAINEISDESLIAFNRTIAISDSHSFKDNFIGEHDSVLGLNAPGYAVHIYEIN